MLQHQLGMANITSMAIRLMLPSISLMEMRSAYKTAKHFSSRNALSIYYYILSELISHSLWWEGPPWLTKPPTHWPIQAKLKQIDTPDEDQQNCLVARSSESLISLEMYSSLSHLLSVTAWIYRFIWHLSLA